MPIIDKRRIRTALTTEPLRRVAGPVHHTVTSAELLIARGVDAMRGGPWVPDVRLRDVTAIIKTFERPRSLRRLLDSLSRRFPEVSIIVADDSREPSRLRGAEVIALPFDSGVSLGRQAALDRVRTRYTWLLDDDFVLYRGTRLDLALEALERHSDLDLVGGPVINLPFLTKNRSDPGSIFPTSAAPRIALGPHVSGLEVCDKVPNFYLARTDRLRLVGWTPELKRVDHADFFTRARGVLATAYCDRFRCLHVKTPFDREYMRHRLECEADNAIISQRYFARER